MKFIDIKGKIADELEIPDNVITENPNIRIIGNRKIIIETHDGVSAYEKEYVTVNSKHQIIQIKGNDLKIEEINNYIITIEGQILEIKIKQKE